MARKMVSLLLVAAVVVLAVIASSPAAEANVPALYVFGDSTADVGNNNFLTGTGTPKANFPHNGVDFPGGVSTGRFSNGFNGVDFLAKMMGFQMSPPPILSIKNEADYFRGISFASGGSGILDITGQNKSLTMNEQINYFEKTVEIITNSTGKERANVFLSKSLFIFSIGSNDMFGFYRQFAPKINVTQKEHFISLLALNFKDQLQRLYKLGGRKFAVIGSAHLGCIPALRITTANGECMEGLNDLSRRFNRATLDLLHGLSLSLQGMEYSFTGSYRIISNVMKKPLRFGYRDILGACCGSGKLNAAGGCLPNATFCSDRRQFMFWDAVHPTEATYRLVAEHAFRGSLPFTTPMNIEQLART